MVSVETAGLTTDMAGLQQSVGRRLGPDEWAEMTQALVNEFADLTGDHNFIHVDPERAKQTGLNKLRFPGPLKVGSRYRGSAEIISVSEVRGGLEATVAATLEVEGAERPAVVAECLLRFYT